MQREKRYLVNLVREGGFTILRKYIPPTLFMTTNLPPVRVHYPRTCGQVKLSFAGKMENEDPQLALSVFIPGNPSYRLPVHYGAFIPLSSPKMIREEVGGNSTRYLTCIDEFYSLDVESDIADRLDAITQNLPAELKRFANKYSLDINVMLVDGISPIIFECPSRHPQVSYHWYFSPYMASTYMIHSTSFRGRAPPVINVVKNTSKSYGRFCGVTTRSDELPEISKKLGLISKLLDVHLRVRIADVLRLLYAVDYRVDTWRFKDVQPSHNVSPDDKALEGKRIRGGHFEGVKALASCKDNLMLVAIGYRIRNSHLLEIDLGHYLRGPASEFIGKLIEEVSSTSSVPTGLDQLYKYITVNTMLVNVLSFFASNDLQVQSLVRPIIPLDLLLRVASAYYDLSGNALADKARTRGAKDVAEELVRRIIEVLDRLNSKEPYALLVKYFIAGERSVTSRKGQDVLIELKKASNEIVKALTEALGDGNGDWRVSALQLVLSHLISHHMISRISITSRVPVNYLAEVGIDENASLLAESMSGGVKAIETAIESWFSRISKQDYTDVLSDFVFSLGSCTIGSAEDLVYYAIVSMLLSGGVRDLDSIKRRINDVAVALNVVFTPRELEEAEKVCNVVVNEAEKLASIIGRYKPTNLINEVFESRFECEKTVKRSCTLDELALYVLKRLSSLPTLRDTIEAMLTKTIERKTKLHDTLEKLYGVSDSKVLVDKFIDDLTGILNGNVKNNLADALSGKFRVKGIERPILVTAQLVRSVIMRLALKSCDDACGLCYVNQSSCVYGAPWVQRSTLSRRLGKLYTTYIVQKKLLVSRGSDIGKIIGKMATPSGSMYMTTPR